MENKQKSRMNKKGAIKQIVVNLVLTGLFLIAMIYFANGILIQNSSNQSINDIPGMSGFTQDMVNNVASTGDNANGSNIAFQNTQPTSGGTFGPVYDSVSNIWNTITLVPKAVYKLTLGLISDKVFGGNQQAAVFFTTFTSLLVIVVILYAYLWIRLGQPDS